MLKNLRVYAQTNKFYLHKNIVIETACSFVTDFTKRSYSGSRANNHSGHNLRSCIFLSTFHYVLLRSCVVTTMANLHEQGQVISFASTSK